MIDTKENYQQAFIKLAHTSIDEETRTELYRTIEAPREVARAGRNVVREELFGWESRGNESLQELGDKIRFLPDWLLKSG